DFVSSASARRSGSSSTTMKSHVCRLQDDGAQRPASSTSSTSSRGTARARSKRRTLRRARIASPTSMPPAIPGTRRSLSTSSMARTSLPILRLCPDALASTPDEHPHLSREPLRQSLEIMVTKDDASQATGQILPFLLAEREQFLEAVRQRRGVAHGEKE